MKKLPTELQKAIFEAISSGNMDAIEDLIDKAASFDPEAAKYLDELAQSFEYDKLLELTSDSVE